MPSLVGSEMCIRDRPVGYHDSPRDLPWTTVASHGLERHAPRVSIGYGAATARVIVVLMARALALATADHANTIVRAMAAPTVCSGMACRGIAVDCNGILWYCRGFAWIRPCGTAMPCHKKSNGFPAAQGNMRAVHCSNVLVLYTWYSTLRKVNHELHASCNPPRCAMRWSCCGGPFTR